MRTLAFDGRMGASGDMLLAALVAAGADPDALSVVESALPVRYEVRTVRKNGIEATAVDVLLSDRDDSGHGDDAFHEHDTDYDADNDHDADDDHDHSHSHDHAEGSGPTRTYEEVLGVVDGMDLPDGVAADARAVFELLGRAESDVHGTDLEGTTFHEVGADDAIADVVGVCLLVEDLDVERVVTAPVATGDGTVETSHGTYPVPVPAVVELAERADWSIRGGPVEAELLTPTGAALLAHFAEGVDSLPPLSVAASGYGAGGYDFPEYPNVLRAVVGRTQGRLRRDEITVLETNLDDATPEELGSLQETLTRVGARDVAVVPATMKKSRPGHVVKVVVKPEDAERVARRLAVETGTLGVREHGAGHRFVADRRIVTTTLLEADERYEVRVKLGTDTAGAAVDVSAEHDDALAVAGEADLPVREVARRAEAAAREAGATAETLVHVVEADRWEEFAGADAYAPPSLAEEGFVHLSTAETVLRVARQEFDDAEDPRLVVVDRASVEQDLRFEETVDGTAFPHLYGELPTGAVREVLALERDDEGRFVLPEGLR